jgi:hypothetical protein
MASKSERLGWVCVVLGLVLWTLLAAVLPAQTSEMPTTADLVIEQMAAEAGVIFAGQVTAVRRPVVSPESGEDAAKGVVEVEFRVGQAVRGPAAGSVYMLREWAGLWGASGGGRYRVGQRLLVFFYPPDANGLSSPVRGLDGAVPLRGGGAAPGPDDSTYAAGQWLVDLRWVQAQALRNNQSAAPPRGPGSPRPISPVPIRPGPVYLVPVRPVTGESPTLAGVKLEGAGPHLDAAPNAPELTAPPVRRPPLPAPQPAAAPAEMQPLTQVIALCREELRGSDGLR